MKQGRKDYEGAVGKGPFATAVKVSLSLLIFGILVNATGWITGWCFEPAEETKEQLSPSATLDKYEWFRDVSAQLEKKLSDIHALSSRIRALSAFCKKIPFYMWKQEYREQANAWVSELAQIQASFNDLAAHYNSEMARFNWRFANAAELPQGAEKPLPREYKPLYVTPSVTTIPPIR